MNNKARIFMRWRRDGKPTKHQKYDERRKVKRMTPKAIRLRSEQYLARSAIIAARTEERQYLVFSFRLRSWDCGGGHCTNTVELGG